MTTPQEPENVEETGPKDNPEWEPLWKAVSDSGVPEAFVEKFKESAKGFLSDSDKRYQEVSTKYAPYKEYADAGIPGEAIKVALSITEQINTDGPGFYKNLGDYLRQQGFSTEEVKEAVKAAKENEGTDDEPDELREIRERQTAIETRISKDEYDRNVESFTKQLLAGFDKVKSEHEKGPLAGLPFDKDFIMPYVQQQINTNGKYDVQAAYNQWAGMMQRAQQIPRPGQTAPRVTPGSGGGGGAMPLNTDGVDGDKLNKMSRSQRVAEALKYMQTRQE